ncbi:recombination protein O N-terminal domain-containing protein [bacterium]|nr:recombination protein O N-terminal domain-containing protein [bacterium]
MAAVILHGIIINVIDYDVYDQIITILLPSNLKVALISKGSRKILSKNGRLISILNQVEVSCFLASDIKKISKLKKIENCISFD